MENAHDDINGFTKEHALILKGILIFMLLFHHLFFPDKLEEYAVNTFIHDPFTLLSVVTWCKICVAGFCFITAYGVTKKFMEMPHKNLGGFAEIAVIRLIKLEMTVWFIYILAALYKRVFLSRPLLDYENGSIAAKIIYALFDAVGLAEYAGTPTINVTWWYLSLFILLIVSMPLIYCLYSKCRYVLLGPAILLPAVIFAKTDILYSELLPVAFIGTAFAYENIFEKIGKWNSAKGKLSLRKLILLAALILCGWFSFELNRYVNYSISWMLVFFLPLLVQEYIGRIPVLSHILKFIGTQTTNIFLIHTFIYYYFYTDVIYSLGDSWKIYLTTFLLSLTTSLIIECLKRILQYNRLTDLVCTRAGGMINPPCGEARGSKL